MSHVTHYALGTSFDSPCGRTSMWHNGLAFTRTPSAVSCQNCRRMDDLLTEVGQRFLRGLVA